MNETTPNYIVHYNRSEPFRSICEVSQENLPFILSQLNESNSWGLDRFSDQEYLPRRLHVEEKIRRQFIDKGGIPELNYPIYFFLGNNARFEENKNNIGYRISLADISPLAVSFTYGDSMFSMCENYRRKLGHQYLSYLCSQVYRIDELQDLYLAMNDVPQKLHIECQLWMKPTTGMYTRIS